MPWLTQHQSCCPVCKRSVLESDDDEEVGSVDEERHDAGQGQAGEGIEVRDQAPVDDQGEANGDQAPVQVAVGTTSRIEIGPDISPV